MTSTRTLARPRRGLSAVPFVGDVLALTRLLRDPKASWGPKLLALAAVVYVVSPIDAFPEGLAPAIGWLDDVGLVLALRLFLDRQLSTYRYPLFEAPPAGAPRADVIDAELEEVPPARRA